MPIPTPQPTWTILDSSKLNDLMTCPRMMFYSHVLGWKPETQNQHLHFGTCWHSAMEHLLLHGYSNESISAAYELLLHEYRSRFTPESDEIHYPKIPDNAFVVLIKYCEKYKHDLETHETVYTEIGGTVSIGDQKELHYRMDSILKRRADGKYGSREHKTGSQPWLWAEQWPLAFQVGTYNHVLYCLYGPDETYGVEMNGCLFGSKASKKGWAEALAGKTLSVQPPWNFIRVPILKNRSQMQSWLQNANTWYDVYQQELDILMTEDNDDNETMKAFPMNTCSCIRYGRVCEYQDFCLAWPNPVRKTDQIPIGFVQSFWNPLEVEPKKRLDLE